MATHAGVCALSFIEAIGLTRYGLMASHFGISTCQRLSLHLTSKFKFLVLRILLFILFSNCAEENCLDATCQESQHPRG